MSALDIASLVIGCFVGLAGWFSGRDKKISNDGEWRGGVNAMLSTIHNDIGGVSSDIRKVQDTINEHGERITAVEKSAASAHKRIDGLVRGDKGI